jgi:sec-independent protein translocase protein TatA
LRRLGVFAIVRRNSRFLALKEIAMGSFSIWHLLIFLAIVLLLFGGRGKIPNLMKDMGQGITAFKKGLKGDDKPSDPMNGDKAIEADVINKDKAAG